MFAILSVLAVVVYVAERWAGRAARKNREFSLTTSRTWSKVVVSGKRNAARK